jgi:putative ABC transport system ATP-binding protein
MILYVHEPLAGASFARSWSKITCGKTCRPRQKGRVTTTNKSGAGGILEARNLTRTYASGGRSLTVLDDVSFEIARRATCAIVGPSGSGKTTLLGLCAGLDLPTSGSVIINGTSLNELNENQRALLRNEHTGFVFQNFQLLPNLTALENVMIPAELRGERGISANAKQLLARVGLGDRMEHYPSQLSGGEQQRVGLARAFINRPHILFADEPTGNLDAETAARVVDLIFELNAELDTALVLVTHDLELARRTDRILRLRGGRLVEDTAAVPA